MSAFLLHILKLLLRGRWSSAVATMCHGNWWLLIECSNLLLLLMSLLCLREPRLCIWYPKIIGCRGSDIGLPEVILEFEDNLVFARLSEFYLALQVENLRLKLVSSRVRLFYILFLLLNNHAQLFNVIDKTLFLFVVTHVGVAKLFQWLFEWSVFRC